MKYKALISDFDNTLVGSSNKIDSGVSADIKRIIDQGIFFAIATGRPFFGAIVDECKRNRITGPQIVSGGAAIISPIDQKVLYAEYVPEKEAREIINFLHTKGFILLLQTIEKIYTTNGEVFPVFGDKTIFADIKKVDFSQILQVDLSPVIVKLDQETALNIQEQLMQKYKFITGTLVHYGGYYGLNITSAGATKHTGVLEYMKLMKLNPEEVIGVGDGYNDYPLLSACGLKVAMGDAPDELKQIADIIIPPQSENGLRTLFTTYF